MILYVFIISIIRPELFECKQIRKASNFGVMPNINRLTSAPVVTSQLFRCLSSVSNLLDCCLYFDGKLVKFQLNDSCLPSQQDPLSLVWVWSKCLWENHPRRFLTWASMSWSNIFPPISPGEPCCYISESPFWYCSFAIKLFPPRKIGKNSLFFDFTESS